MLLTNHRGVDHLQAEAGALLSLVPPRLSTVPCRMSPLAESSSGDGAAVSAARADRHPGWTVSSHPAKCAQGTWDLARVIDSALLSTSLLWGPNFPPLLHDVSGDLSERYWVRFYRCSKTPGESDALCSLRSADPDNVAPSGPFPLAPGNSHRAPSPCHLSSRCQSHAFPDLLGGLALESGGGAEQAEAEEAGGGRLLSLYCTGLCFRCLGCLKRLLGLPGIQVSFITHYEKRQSGSK